MEKGFTLIETMATLVILAVGLLALGTFYISLIDRQQVAQERIIAVHLAEQVMEFWQHDTNDYVPTISSACVLSTGSSSTPGTIPPCTPASFPVKYTIQINTTPAQAPLPTKPNGCAASDPASRCKPLVNQNAGAFAIRDMKPVLTPSGSSVTPMLKVVKVSWSHKGKARQPIVLTHISSLK